MGNDWYDMLLPVSVYGVHPGLDERIAIFNRQVH